MKILILGHGKTHRQIRSENCITCNKDYYEKLLKDDKNIITTLDKDESVLPDVVWDFFKYKYPFEEREFDIIIDASGQSLARAYHNREFWEEINRILRLHGFFFGRIQSLFHSYSHSAPIPNRNSDFDTLNEDAFSEEIALINRYGLYEKPHPGNQQENFLSLQKVHKTRYE